ncbi:uncharacterized protein LOC124124673 [Haliotis rufescens]|uniref:uncharacterized protein LOC124124673 n=1 Tax=Haliotis rufescens TaxID=6454 RepID=UPI00201EF8A5|nr:uncharacterized protein LOC124124673 [Haliotis rufescens]
MSGSESSFIHNTTTTSEPPPSRRHRSRALLYIIFAVSLISNVVLAVIFGIHTLKPRLSHQRNTDASSVKLDHVGSNADVCFTCGQLGPLVESQDTPYDVIRTSGHHICCQRNKVDVTEMFKKMIVDEFSRRTSGSDQLDSHAIKKGNRDVIHSGSTGAHLVMVPIKGSPPAWTAHDDYHVTFCANVACDNGTIWVRDAGIYLVYSHITLNVTRGSTYTIFTHRMHLTRRNMPPKQLLMSKTSFTRTASPQRNSFLSAVLKLEERDAIGVYIPDQNTDLVEKGGFSNYMGIFKL